MRPVTRIAPHLAAVQRLWQTFCATAGVDHYSLDAVECFGDSPSMADELMTLVMEGPKRATAGLVRDYTEAGWPMPRVGGHWIVLDGRGTPCCILRTTELRIGLLHTVDEAFAWEEGEGGRTRADWLTAHRSFFQRQAEQRGTHFDETSELVVFERFKLVWPLG